MYIQVIVFYIIVIFVAFVQGTSLVDKHNAKTRPPQRRVVGPNAPPGSTRYPPRQDDSVYPISASFFKDRFTLQEWNNTLRDFAKIGGDTVLLRAPPVVIRTAMDIKRDPAFQYCGSINSSTGAGPPHCVDEAVDDLTNVGVIIDDFATYEYEEDFNFNLILCGIHEKIIHSSRVYYRLVLPVNSTTTNPCNLQKGDHVLVLITMFSGVDPHALLLEAAGALNMSVYFGLPGAPRTPGGGFATDYLSGHYGFVQRVLTAHKMKYGPQIPPRHPDNNNSPSMSSPSRQKITLMDQSRARPIARLNQYRSGLNHFRSRSRSERKKLPWDVVVGYYATDEANLATDLTSHNTSKKLIFLELYKALGTMIRGMQKKFLVSPSIEMNKSFGYHSLETHVAGYEALAKLNVVDIIAVQEGRGSGKGCYYWPTEEHMAVVDRDPVLDQIIRYLDPTVPKNVTFKQQFTASVNELFRGLADKRSELQSQGFAFDLWLSVDAFEYLREDPCLPIDPAGSGMDQLLQRTSKQRLDWAIAMAGVFPQKIASFAWDSDFTCLQDNRRLADEIHQEVTQWNGNPIISNCSFHNSNNMSFVLIGYALVGLTQGYNVTYTTREGKIETTSLNPYYVEMDWGLDHGRHPALVYTQLYDPIPYDIAQKGVVKIQPNRAGAQTYCIYEYDYE